MVLECLLFDIALWYQHFSWSCFGKSDDRQQGA